jgi:hypothetical protein
VTLEELEDAAGAAYLLGGYSAAREVIWSQVDPRLTIDARALLMQRLVARSLSLAAYRCEHSVPACLACFEAGRVRPGPGYRSWP